MQLIQARTGENYKVLINNANSDKSKLILSPGTAFKLVLNDDERVIIHAQGKRYSMSKSEAMLINIETI